MTKIYLPEELNSFSRETLVAVILSMQDQLAQLNTNMERTPDRADRVCKQPPLWALFRKAGCDCRATGTGAHL